MEPTKPTTIDLIGAYRVLVSPRSLADAARFLRYEYLLDENGKFKIEDCSHQNLNDVTLIELEVTGPLSMTEIRMGKGSSAQVPYLEFYLSPSGDELLFHPIANRYLPKSMFQTLRLKAHEEPRRMCFFLHRVQPGSKIQFGKECIAVGPAEILLARLMRFAHYVPVD